MTVQTKFKSDAFEAIHEAAEGDHPLIQQKSTSH